MRRNMTPHEPALGLPTKGLPGRLRSFRASRRLAQGELATLLGVERRTIVRWERSGAGGHTTLIVLAVTALADRMPADTD